ncbi:MAG TPA: malonyl-ACP O-methyltransferase BioC [Phycisphaerae bacterium]|nr:malonyl-ACP O-methyltransferase BioC [Phycisphaerae bacterium]
MERHRIGRRFSAASHSYDGAARLQRVVRNELLERLPNFKVAPRCVLDLGAGTGHATLELKRRYRDALVVGVDLAPGMLREAGQRLGWRERWLGGRLAGRRGARFERVAGDAYRLPLADHSIDLVFSSLMLQWCDDLDAAFAEIRRVLQPGGLLLFSSFGPATLQELRAAWAAVDDAPHVNRFLDMHDVGNALMQAGLEQPVLDTDTHELQYDTPLELMRDLQRIGANNVAAGRRRGLTGRHALAAMSAKYETLRRDGALPATYEVVYGVAWAAAGPSPSPSGVRNDANEHVVPLSALSRRRVPP